MTDSFPMVAQQGEEASQAPTSPVDGDGPSSVAENLHNTQAPQKDQEGGGETEIVEPTAITRNSTEDAPVAGGTTGGGTRTIAPVHSTRPFPVREISYFDRPCTIILQEENGPCPLIALCNILSLRGRMDLKALRQHIPNQAFSYYVKRDDLTNALATMIMERLETSAGTGDSATRRFNFTDALEALPKFVQGMDINVKFLKVNDYEASREVAVLDAAGVELVHGWIADPEEKGLIAELSPGNHSYNVMVEKTMNDQAPFFRTWLEQSASQLTFAGLFALQADLQEADIKMLFRNNHYSVITKRKGTLFNLISDAGMSRPNAVWESIADTDGQASQIVDSWFGDRPPARNTPPPLASGGGGHIVQGRLVGPAYSPVVPQPSGGGHYGGENSYEAREYGARGHAARRKPPKKEDDCCSMM